MSYSTIQEVRDMVKGDALNALIGDSFIEDQEERENAFAPIIAQAIEDADGEIDGYLAKRYPVPISPTPKIINKFSKDIAVYNIFSRVGINEDSEQKNYLNRYQAAIKFLTLLAEGKVSIGEAGSDGKALEARTGFVVKSSPRVFSREFMRGW